MRKKKTKKKATKKLNNYQKMVKAQANYCNTGSESAKEKRDKAVERYINDAVSKGQTKTEAKKKAKNVTKSCKR